MITEIKNGNKTLAIIIPKDFSEKGIHFFTPDSFSQQLAYMNYSKGKEIQPHNHNPVKRNVHYTLEVLFIKKGKLRVDFYDDKKYLKSCILVAGDIILLAGGGHGFEVLEDLEMFEVKQGPYTGDKDKTRFDGISKDQIVLKK
jgi:mannose-6-phosphate isomerase-like protein (cupin superfamily)